MRLAFEDHLNNETRYFLLGDPLLGHQDPEAILEHFQDAEQRQRDVKAGLYLPLGQPHDGGFPFRLVIGDCNPQEEAEWLACAEGQLVLQSGQLALCGGDSLLQYNAAAKRSRRSAREQLEILNDQIRYLRVPHGHYWVRVLAYLPGQLAIQALESGEESLGAWFRRTHPGQRYPNWLIDLAYESRLEDPDENWERVFFAQSQNRHTPLIHYVVHLQALDANQPQEKQTHTDSEGALLWQIRRPEICPLGLEQSQQNQVTRTQTTSRQAHNTASVIY